MNSQIIKIALIVSIVLTLVAGGAILAGGFKDGWLHQRTDREAGR